MASVLYYVSGHGFGHARRCAETIKLLNRTAPGLPIHVRTMAHRDVFSGCDIRFEQVQIDRGAVEIDALNIDWTRTLENVRSLIADRAAFVAHEAAYLRENDVRLIIADVPFMAGYVAEAAGVPCYAQCNFMWDWIYEPHTDDRQLLDAIAGGYRRMTGWLRLPFPHACDHFASVRDVPFITSPLTLTPEQARAELGIAPTDHRRVVLIGMRGGTDESIIANLRRSADRYLFITAAGPALEGQRTHAPLRFWDAMQICDAVVSKPGHGIVTDCAALGVGLLHPPRNGFREDAMILREGARVFRERQIPLEDYASGNWTPHLDALLAQRKPKPATNVDGREMIAHFICQQSGAG